LKLSRSLQKRRSSTLNADKILKYTHTITRMQRMYFTIKTPAERPSGEVFFIEPGAFNTLPDNCWSVYLLARPAAGAVPGLIEKLPKDALVIDYTMSPLWARSGLRPKKELEARVGTEWE